MDKRRTTKNAPFFCALALLAFLVLPSAADALCLPHLTSYLKLDEASNSVFADESPNGIGGSCTTCPTPTSAGRISYARTFSAASGSTIQIPYNSKLNWVMGHDFAVEFWMKHGTAAPAGAEVVIGRLDSGSQMQWRMGMNTGGRIFAEFIADDGSGSSASVISAGALNDNTWHHIALVHADSANTNRLYVDGQLSNTATVSYTAGFSSATGVTIGGLNGGSYFNGTIDEVAIYRSVLTLDQILQHYNDGMVGLRDGYCGSDSDIRIMPLGDSITRGSNSTVSGHPELAVGYRQELYFDLLDADNDNLTDYYVDFVGRYTDGNAATPAFDYDHEGVSAQTADQIAARVPDAFTANAADVVLVHAGTNDMSGGSGAIPQTVADVETILDNIWNEAPNATVFLARIINRWPLDSATSDFNDALATMANARIAAGDRLVLVDLESALTVYNDWDTNATQPILHPSSQGYLKMAAKWYSALAQVLPPTNEAVPTIISDAGTKNAVVGELFTFEVESDGNPLPTYSLTTQPDPAMIIGSTSGLIQWTPTATGLYDVAVKAVNANGEDTFSFQINVTTTPVPPDDPGDSSSGGGGGGGCFISTIIR